MIDPDAIMQRVHGELERRQDAALAAGAPVGSTGAAGTSAWRRSAASRLPDKDRYVLADFVAFDDDDFIEVAYCKLLRRQPDDQGSMGYLRALRGGALGKIEILGMLRSSEEGRRQAVRVDGLSRLYRLYRWRRIPVLGWFLGMAMALVRLPRLAWRLQGLDAAIAHTSLAVAREWNELGAGLAALEARLGDNTKHLEARLGDNTKHLETRLGDNTTHLEMLETVFQTRAKEYAEFRYGTGGQLEEHAAALARLTDAVGEDRRRLRAMLERLTVFLDATVRNAAQPVGQNGAGGRTELEAHYASFEDTFRGAREQIKLRVAQYLDTLAAAGIAPSDDGVILDLGSGRGEWLEVLAEHGYRGRGVDSNRGMLKASEARGHDVVEANALDFMRAQDDNQYAAITSMHMVEHIPHAVLLALLDEALRVLRPGGVLILETPNPENLFVGSCNFYMDPTHLKPIPPLLLQWVVQACGFEQVRIERLSAHRGEPAMVPVADEVPGAHQINQLVGWFNTALDYAVIARKPGEGSLRLGTRDAQTTAM